MWADDFLSLFFFFFFHFFFFFFCFFLKNFLLELVIFSVLNYDLSLMLIFDLYSCLFSSFVFLISGVVVFYSHFYMKGDLNIFRYFTLLLLFVLSMIILIFSPNLISMMVGWDGLGLVSFCLIIYYGGFSSLRSGLVSIYINRLGDMGLLLCSFFFCFCFFWMNFSFFDFFHFWFFYIFILSGMTKSAQIPFSSWLPAAMAAPTPISSLVHSSTLVTAGVYLLLRFNYLMSFLGGFIFFSYFSISTMIMAGLIALFEHDMKKIVAMSTLSQLGLMMFLLSFGEVDLCFFHMISHALFKSLLFLSCGGLISSSFGSQDLRSSGSSFFFSPIFSFFFSFSSLSLAGFPFLVGFFSKDSCLDCLLEYNASFFLFFLFFFGCIMTFSYSFRLFLYGMSTDLKISFDFTKFFSFSMCFSLFFLFFYVTFGGFFVSFFFLGKEMIFSFSFLKSVGIFIFFFGFLVSFRLFLLLKKMFFDLSSSMFWMDYFFGIFLSNNFSKMIFFSFFDLTWVEKFGPMGIFSLCSKTGFYFFFYPMNYFFRLKTHLFFFVYFFWLFFFSNLI